MTARTRARRTPSTATNWRIELILGRAAHHTETGRVALPLWLSRDGRHVADAPLSMSTDEAAALRAQLGQLLGDESGPGDAL